jgi:hypothetical protein
MLLTSEPIAVEQVVEQSYTSNRQEPTSFVQHRGSEVGPTTLIRLMTGCGESPYSASCRVRFECFLQLALHLDLIALDANYRRIMLARRAYTTSHS